MRMINLGDDQVLMLYRLVKREAVTWGYSTTYHDMRGYRGGPQDWPSTLTELVSLLRKLRDAQVGGEAQWPDGSPQTTTPTVLSAKTSSSRGTRRGSSTTSTEPSATTA